VGFEKSFGFAGEKWENKWEKSQKFSPFPVLILNFFLLLPTKNQTFATKSSDFARQKSTFGRHFPPVFHTSVRNVSHFHAAKIPLVKQMSLILGPTAEKTVCKVNCKKLDFPVLILEKFRLCRRKIANFPDKNRQVPDIFEQKLKFFPTMTNFRRALTSTRGPK